MGSESTIDGIPDDLLSHICNFFTLAELVRLMPVSRRWRVLVIEHRTYWMDIALKQDSSLAPATEAETRLFALRLARSAPRPISVLCESDNVDTVLPHIAAHLTHIKSLRITTILPLAAQVMAALCHAAPILERLVLYFHDGAVDCMPVPVPVNLFDFDAPALTFASLTTVFIQPLLPPVFQRLKFLGVGGMVVRIPDVRFEIPDVFTACPDLREVGIHEDVVLHPAFWSLDVWANIDRLSMSTGLNGRISHHLNLPILRVPFVAVQTDQLDTLPILAGHLRGALNLSFNLLDTNEYSSDFIVTMKSSASPRLTRQLYVSIARPPSRFHAIENAGMWTRVSSLTLPLLYWDEYAALFFRGTLPALEDLVLLLYHPPRADAGGSTLRARVVCPHLKRLVFRNCYDWSGKPATVDIELLAALATQLLDGAPFPLDLHLGNMRLDSEGAADSASETIAAGATFRTVTTGEKGFSTSV